MEKSSWEIANQNVLEKEASSFVNDYTQQILH